ncbi:hypothetical protein JCM8202v2_003564 [Rhodotorula sphaerocarpa]
MEYDYVDGVPAALECPICRCALVDPVRTPECDHLFCRSCLHRALELQPRCPVDRVPVASLHLCPPPHRAIRDLLAQLKVRTCTGQVLTRDEADRQHAAQLATPSCERPALGPSDDEDPLPPDPVVACEYCTLLVPRSRLPAHLLHTCSTVPLPCPHAPRGCPYSGPRTLLEQDHLAAECPYEPLRHHFLRQDALHAQLEGEKWHLQLRVQALESTCARLEATVQRLADALGDFAPSPLVEEPRPVDLKGLAREVKPTLPTPRRRPSNPSASPDDSAQAATPATTSDPSSPSLSPSRPAAPTTASTIPPQTAPPPAPAPAPAASLSSTLSTLQTSHAHLAQSLSSLAHAHAHSLAVARATHDECGQDDVDGSDRDAAECCDAPDGGGGVGGGGAGSDQPRPFPPPPAARLLPFSFSTGQGPQYPYAHPHPQSHPHPHSHITPPGSDLPPPPGLAFGPGPGPAGPAGLGGGHHHHQPNPRDYASPATAAAVPFPLHSGAGAGPGAGGFLYASGGLGPSHVLPMMAPAPPSMSMSMSMPPPPMMMHVKL